MIHDIAAGRRQGRIERRTPSPATIARKSNAAVSSGASALRQHIGNQGIQRLVAVVSANSAATTQLHAPSIQAKLTVSQPGDAYEQEADRVAEQVMRMPASVDSMPSALNDSRARQAGPPVTSNPGAQAARDCACGGTCDSCKAGQTEGEGTAQRQSTRPQIARAGSSPTTGAMTVPASVHEVLRSPGQPLSSSVRAFFEPRFGADFSQVRVHADSAAQRSAQDINANAYTVGRSIAFGPGRFAPETHEGRRLLAHELTHVVQQQGAGSALIHRQCGGKLMPPCANQWVSQPSSSGIGSAFGHWLGLQYLASHKPSSYVLVDWWVYGSHGKVGTIGGNQPNRRTGLGLAYIDPAVMNALQARPDWARSGTNRTDILASDTDEVFEIKPIRGAGAGPAQLAGYLASLRAVAPTAPSWMGGRARDWQPGRWEPTPHLFAATGSCIICTWADRDNQGVLLYDLLCCDSKEPPEGEKPKDKEPSQAPGPHSIPLPSLPELLKLGAKVLALLAADALLSAALSFVGSLAVGLAPLLALAALALGVVFLWDKIKSLARMVAGAAKFVLDKIKAIVGLVGDVIKKIGIKIGELAVWVGGVLKQLAEKIADGLLWAGRRALEGAKWLGRRIASGAEAIWDWLWGSDVEAIVPIIDLPITPEPTRCVAVTRQDALIQLSSDLLFPYREWELTKLKPEGLAALKGAAAKVLSTPRTGNDPIRFLGFTDNIGSHEFNQKLSERRAGAVAQWFVQNGVVPASKVKVEGYGKTEAKGKDREGRKSDRRVDILVTKKGSAQKACW